MSAQEPRRDGDAPERDEAAQATPAPAPDASEPEAPAAEGGAPPAPEGAEPDREAPEDDLARPGPGPAPEPPAPPHPLAGKGLWLGLTALLFLACAALAAASPFFAGEASPGWIAAALALGGPVALLEAFATPARRGGTWRIAQGAGLTAAGLLAAFAPILGGLPVLPIAAGGLLVYGVGGVLCAIWESRSRGWPITLLAGLVAGGAGAAILFLRPPPAPDLAAIILAAALAVSGLAAFGLAGAARRT